MKNIKNYLLFLESIELEDIIKHYNKPIYSRSHDEHQKVGWFNKDGQYKRFNHLLNIGVKENDYILDYGCGLGDLLNYINENSLNINYFGVDINPFFIKSSIDKYGEYFKLINNYKEIKNKFDWVLASGVFTVHTSNYDLYDTIEYFYKIVNKGLSFNLMKSPFYDEEMDNVSRNIPIRGYNYDKIFNYFYKKYKKVKLIPFIDRHEFNEFTVYIYK